MKFLDMVVTRLSLESKKKKKRVSKGISLGKFVTNRDGIRQRVYKLLIKYVFTFKST